MALVDVVKNLFEQLQQVQRQLAQQQSINAEQARQIDSLNENDVNMNTVIVKQARQIDALTKNDVKQAQQVNRLTDNVARLEAEHKVIAAHQDTGTGCCMSALIACRPFSSVLLPAMYI